MQTLHFLRPYLLLAIIPAVIAIILLFYKGRSQSSWSQICDAHLLRHLTVDAGRGRARASLIIFLVTLTISVIAMAGPAWRQAEQPAFRNQRAVVVVLDMSYSMLAQDIKPSRVERAKYKVLDLLESNKDGQTSLVVFAGDAHAVTPLTDDINTIKSQIEPLDPMIMPFPGSRPDQGVKRALELLKNGTTKNGEIILLTDGTDDYWEQLQDVAAEVNGAGHMLSIIGVGTADGAPIPSAEGGFVQNRAGGIVLPKLDENKLKRVATETDGRYFTIAVDGSDIAAIDRFNLQKKKIDKEKKQQVSAAWSDDGYWLIFLILPVVLFSFRKGVVFTLVFAVMLLPDFAHAADEPGFFASFWQRKEQVGIEQFKQGDFDKAEQNLQKDPLWKGAVQYKAGKFEEAVKTLEQEESALADYNRGNALAQLEKYEEAVAAYKQALEKDPDNADAKHNKELIEEQLQRQESQEQQSQDQQPYDKDSESQEQDGQQQDGEQQEGQEQDGKKKDGEQQEREKNQGQQSEDEQPPLDSENQGKEEQGKEQQEPEKESEQAKQAREAEEKKEAQQMLQESEEPQPETKESQKKPLDQKTEQWLRQIPDNPGGLLKRKFYYESKKKYDKGTLPHSKNKW